MRKMYLMGLVLGAQLAAAGPAAADSNDFCNGAMPMALNSTRSSTLAPAGDRDHFQIDVSQPGRLTIYSTGGTDTYGSLLSSSCGVILNNDDDGPGVNFRIVRDVNPGRYKIKVRHFSPYGTGSYGLRVDFQPNNPEPGPNCSTAMSVPLGGSVGGSIGWAGDVDTFRIEVPWWLGTPFLQFYTTGSEDTFGTLLNASCAPIAVNDDRSPWDLNFLISRYGNGTFYVKVKHYNPYDTGAYVFHNRSY